MNTVSLWQTLRREGEIGSAFLLVPSIAQRKSRYMPSRHVRSQRGPFRELTVHICGLVMRGTTT